MKITSIQLTQEILDFMIVIHECHATTTFTNDRSVYAQDLMEAMSWIAEIKNGVEIEKVINKILSPETDKHFNDYWRQGSWGDKEANAFKRLKDRL